MSATIRDRPTSLESFRADVLRGLRAPAKELPCKYFYDETGSELFEQITRLEEYYPTRTEQKIMDQYAPAMTSLWDRRCVLIEYGSGSSAKTRRLLDCLPDLAGYIPIDVSAEFLQRSVRALSEDYPHLRILPLTVDFTHPLERSLPRTAARQRIVYFPGSTIGNFTPAESITLLKQTARLCGRGGGLLLGADMRKDARLLEAAYNDTRGVTAAFNRNILVRINRELDGDFAVEKFDHHAFYNADEGRIEIHLVSSHDQRVHVGNATFFFAAGESIRTEYSLDTISVSLATWRKRPASLGSGPGWTETSISV